MQNFLTNLLAPAVMGRLTLLLNHVIGSEEVAVQRLLPHAGKTLAVRLDDWPTLLPAVPPMHFAITPAGLLEWLGADADAAPDLELRIDGRNPAALAFAVATGATPQASIEGDAALAADVGWLMAHLRWDIAADLERFFGPVAAAQWPLLGAAVQRAMHAALSALGRMPRAPW